MPFIAAYSSCLQRTIDTANHILSHRDVPLFQHQGLNEHFFWFLGRCKYRNHSTHRRISANAP
nr:histidine phosphatase family protein [Pasteurella bettyae]